MLGTVLSSGRSSRLFQKIVREQQLAPNVSAGRDGAVGPGLFRVIGTVAPGKTAEALEAAIYEEIERVKNGPIEDWEIEKARNNAKRGVVGGLTSSLQRAMQLAEFAASFGDTNLINQRVDRIVKVTAADVQRVARTYLVPENRTVVVTMPKGAAQTDRGCAMKRRAFRELQRCRRASSSPARRLPCSRRRRRRSSRRRRWRASSSRTRRRCRTSCSSIKLPRPQEADLPNGLHVMVLEDRRAPQVTIQLSMRGAGGYYDPADHAGLAQFTAANLREGTTTKSTTEIAEQLDRLSATLNVTAGMSSEDATISASALTEHVDAVLDLMADVLLNPTFPEQEFARYKTQTRAQLLQQRANPGFLVAGTLQHRRRRRSSRWPHRADAGGAREDHARRSRGVSPRPLRARPRGASPSPATSRWPTR